jgi:DNA-binding response OmpR family regulator
VYCTGRDITAEREAELELAKAQDAAKTVGDKQHLLISDVILLHINGRKLAEIARATRPGLKVLFVSGYSENAISRGSLVDAGMDLLTKPFELDTLGAK